MATAPPRILTARVCRLFLKLLAVAYLVAFVSLGVQVEGLLGSQGLLPIRALLEWVQAQAGPERFHLLPTLFWLGAGDTVLKLSCAGGALLAVLLFFDIAPALVLFLSWALYLSFVSVGQIFLGYQWDALLLETGLLAIVLAPRAWRPRPEDFEPDPIALWLLRWLLLRLMVSSGFVKLASGDPTWRSLTALVYHYETQPLPTWIGYYLHQMPEWFQRVSAGLMFTVELGAPWLVFGGRRLRAVGCVALVSLQLLIAASGNYGYFNLLAIALSVLMLDDGCLPGAATPAGASPRRWPRWLIIPVASVYGLLSGMIFLHTCGVAPPWPAPVMALYRAVAPFASVNSYGLFAVMTTSRPEIVIEGSSDGTSWREYPFKWKAGDLERAPAFVAPHQPRLDWQMWFAALSRCEQEPWVPMLMERLRSGAPEVLALMGPNPFPDGPPRRIRAALYDYRFTRLGERAWWRRTRLGLYCPEQQEP